MTYEETRQILGICKAEWPQSFRGMSARDGRLRLDLWAGLFADDDPALVAAAVKSLIVAGDREFAPGVGQIKAQMSKLLHPEEMDAAEAWAKIAAAVRNSGYCAAEEFAALPPILQRLVGSPNQLREWGMMDSGTFQSVVASNVQRAYKTAVAREREQAALPADVRELVATIAARRSPEALPGEA